MGEILESFPGNVRVRTKHVEKTRVGQWRQSSIRKVAVIIGIRALTQLEVWPTPDEGVGSLKKG